MIGKLRKPIILVLSLAALACLPLHCYSFPDVNQVTFLSRAYPNGEQIRIRAIDWHLECSTRSYLDASTTELDFRYCLVGYRRLPVLPIKQPQMWNRRFSIPLFMCMLLFTKSAHSAMKLYM